MGERDTSAENLHDKEVEVIREGGRTYYRGDDNRLHLLTPKGQTEPEDSIAELLPFAPPLYSDEQLEPVDFKISLEMSGRGNPHKVMLLANPQYQDPTYIPPYYAAQPISRSESFIHQDPTPTQPYGYAHAHTGYDPNDDVSTHEIPVVSAVAQKPETRVRKTSNREKASRPKADWRVTVPVMAAGALLIAGINFNIGTTQGVSGAEYCDAHGLADIWSGTGCAIQMEAHNLLPILVKEPKHG
jgi:hypothetical protein